MYMIQIIVSATFLLTLLSMFKCGLCLRIKWRICYWKEVHPILIFCKMTESMTLFALLELQDYLDLWQSAIRSTGLLNLLQIYCLDCIRWLKELLEHTKMQNVPYIHELTSFHCQLRAYQGRSRHQRLNNFIARLVYPKYKEMRSNDPKYRLLFSMNYLLMPPIPILFPDPIRILRTVWVCLYYWGRLAF